MEKQLLSPVDAVDSPAFELAELYAQRILRACEFVEAAKRLALEGEPVNQALLRNAYAEIEAATGRAI